MPITSNSEITSVNIGNKQKGQAKTARIPIKVVSTNQILKKPEWIRVKAGNSAGRFAEVKAMLRSSNLHTVCEEASCPNIGECFGRGTASFMILGDICTRRCPFCDVAHGYPNPPDANEPENLAKLIAKLKLNYVVITSVDRDDLRDGGAEHFSQVVQAIKTNSEIVQVEILVPDFRGRLEVALEKLGQALPDVFNHNLETAPRLYQAMRPGSDYQHSLQLLLQFKQKYPHILTKSGLMLGLGESDEEILAVMKDLRAHQVDILTLGQYLAPSTHHAPVLRYVTPERFKEFELLALEMGFAAAACGPMVRSSYWADQLAHRVE